MKKILLFFLVVSLGVLFVGVYVVYRDKSLQQSLVDKDLITASNSSNPVPGNEKDKQQNEVRTFSGVFSGVQESFLLDNGLHMVIQEVSNNAINIPDRQNESEDVRLKKNSTYARRDSQGLHLKKANETEIIIVDIPSEDKPENNYFIDFVKNFNFYIIESSFNEGGAYKLINSITGKETVLGGFPYFSPDGKYILTAGQDLEAGYSFNGLELFENNEGNLRLLKKYRADTWGPQAIQWTNSRSARVKAKLLQIIDNEMKEKEISLEVVIK